MLYWNASNPLLLGGGGGEEAGRLLVNNNLDEQQYDQVHIVCPASNATEFHRVLLVGREEYETCRLNPASRARLVADCSRPHAAPPIIITFREFSPLPGGLEFQPGSSYYFFSPSSRLTPPPPSSTNTAGGQPPGTAIQYAALSPGPSASRQPAAGGPSKASRLSPDHPCRTSLRLAIKVGGTGGTAAAAGEITPEAAAPGVRVNIPRSLDYVDYSSDQMVSSTSRDNRETSGGGGSSGGGRGQQLPPAHFPKTASTTPLSPPIVAIGRREEEGAGHLTSSSGRGLASGSRCCWPVLIVLLVLLSTWRKV